MVSACVCMIGNEIHVQYTSLPSSLHLSFPPSLLPPSLLPFFLHLFIHVGEESQFKWNQFFMVVSEDGVC